MSTYAKSKHYSNKNINANFRKEITNFEKEKLRKQTNIKLKKKYKNLKMSEIMAEEKSEKQNNESENENSLASSTMSAVPTTTTTQPTSEISKDVSTENLLKTLLSTSTALSSSIIAPLSTTKISATVPAESMITKEVNDTQLNLKKILYEPDKEAEKDKDQGLSVQTVSHRNTTDVQTVDDDDRLVIDISDDEHDIQKKKKKKAKSMPLLEKEYESNSKIVIRE